MSNSYSTTEWSSGDDQNVLLRKILQRLNALSGVGGGGGGEVTGEVEVTNFPANQPVTVSNSITASSVPFELAVQRDGVVGSDTARIFRVLGRRRGDFEGVTAQQDLAEFLVGTTQFSDLVGTENMSFVSDNVGDDVGGGGCTMVRITYLDLSGDIRTVDYATNGVTPVAVAEKMLFVYSMESVASGGGTTGTAKVITPHGNAHLDTADTPFGTGAACYIDGAGDYLSTPNHADFKFGTANFTVEFWIKRELNPLPGEYEFVLCFEEASHNQGWNVILDPNDNGKITFQILGAALLVSTTDVCDNTWHHVAVTRTGNNFAMYVDGTSEDTASTANSIPGETFPLWIGDQYVGGNPAGYEFSPLLDELRISKVARYAGNFSVEVANFTADSDTVLLLHFDGADNSTTFTDSSTDFVGNAGNVALGNILLYSDDPITFEKISAGESRSYSGRFMVPSGYTGYLMEWAVGAIGTSLSARLQAQAHNSDRSLSTAYITQDTFFLAEAANKSSDLSYLKCPALSRIKMGVLPATDGGDDGAEASLVILIVAN